MVQWFGFKNLRLVHCVDVVCWHWCKLKRWLYEVVAISTLFYFHRVASRATGMPVEPELAVCCFSLGIKLSTSVFLVFFMQS